MSPDAQRTAARLRVGAALSLLVSGAMLLLLGAPAATATPAAAPAAATTPPATTATAPAAADGRNATPSVAVTTVDGVISPVIDAHLDDAVGQAAADGHEALVVLLDTPGGLVSSMRSIVKRFLDAEVPVIVYVSPTGADAGSAGTFITYAAHIAAMAPATTIGAATPVSLEGGEVDGKIVENAAAFAEAIAEARGRDVEFAIASVRDGRSVTADTALEVGAIDLIVDSLDDLLLAVDGRSVDLGEREVTLRTAGATLVPLELSGAQRLLQLLADPNLAFIFLSLGTLAILYEIANPGLGLGGVVGVASLVLAMFSLSVLPVNYAGAALILLAAGMFIAELFMPGIGVGAAGGTIALLLGGLFLFPAPTGIGVDWWVLAPTVGVMLGLSVLAGVLVARARRPSSQAGSDDVIGRTVIVELTPGGRPRGRIGGTRWRLLPDSDEAPLQAGETVTVARRDNIDLVVRRDPTSVTGAPPTPPGPAGQR